MKIVVVGDIIVDEYWHGFLRSDNPETWGGNIIRVVRSENRLGGAAAVAYLLKSYGDSPLLASVVGSCKTTHRLMDVLWKNDIDTGIHRDPNRFTTIKRRLLVRGQIQPDRYDFDCTEDIAYHYEQVLSSIDTGDVLALVDYGKGVLTQCLCRRLINSARRSNTPVIVDPARNRRWSDYEGATLIKANRLEAMVEASTDVTGGYITTEELAKLLAKKHRCKVVVTDAEDGMAWSDMTHSGHHAAHVTCAQDVADSYFLLNLSHPDPTGCGDVVLASIASRIHDDLHEACRLANRRAGENLYQLGVTPCAF